MIRSQGSIARGALKSGAMTASASASSASGKRSSSARFGTAESASRSTLTGDFSVPQVHQEIMPMDRLNRSLHGRENGPGCSGSLVLLAGMPEHSQRSSSRQALPDHGSGPLGRASTRTRIRTWRREWPVIYGNTAPARRSQDGRGESRAREAHAGHADSGACYPRLHHRQPVRPPGTSGTGGSRFRTDSSSLGNALLKTIPPASQNGGKGPGSASRIGRTHRAGVSLIDPCPLLQPSTRDGEIMPWGSARIASSRMSIAWRS